MIEGQRWEKGEEEGRTGQKDKVGSKKGTKKRRERERNRKEGRGGE